MPRALYKMPLIALRERRAPPGRERLPELMVMDDPESVAEFHEGGATSPGMRAVHDLSARCLDALLPEDGRLLDLGCGSGRALAQLALRRPDVSAVGVDLAPNMLARAGELLAEQGIGDRVDLVEADISELPEGVVRSDWDAVSCVWTLHHLPNPATLDAALSQIAALRDRQSCAVWIVDFQRLRNSETFPAGLRISEPGLGPYLRRDAVASEAAAFTYDELSASLERVGLADVHGGCARPIAWQQAHWAAAAGREPRAAGLLRDSQLERSARLDAAALRLGFTGLPI